MQAFLGGTPEEIPDVYDRASPLLHVGQGEPPFLLVHGDQDVYVPSSHSARMRSALREAGNEADFLLIRGGGHVMNPGASAGDLVWEEFAIDAPEAVAAINEFLARHLGP